MQADGLNNTMAGFTDVSGLKDNLDMIKEMLYDNDPIFVGITLTVSFLHTIFEFLALKNGILKFYSLFTIRYLILEKSRLIYWSLSQIFIYKFHLRNNNYTLVI